jgi:hypothetical protein
MRGWTVSLRGRPRSNPAGIFGLSGSRGSAPAVPYPSTLPSLAGWWDCADPATITLDGPSVVQIRDKSPAGLTMTVVSPSTAPTIAGSFASFDGVSAGLSNPSVALTGVLDFSAYLVASVPSIGSGCCWKNGSSNGYAMGFGSVTFDTSGSELLALAEGVGWIGHGGASSVLGLHLLELHCDGAGLATLVVDRGGVWSGAFDPGVPTDNTSLGFDLSGSTLSRYSRFELGELVLSSSCLLGSAEDVGLAAYFAAAWSLTLP